MADSAYGVELRDLPEGWTPLEVLAIVKCLDEEGDVVWCTRWSAGLSETEGIGMLQVQLATSIMNQVSGFRRD